MFFQSSLNLFCKKNTLKISVTRSRCKDTIISCRRSWNSSENPDFDFTKNFFRDRQIYQSYHWRKADRTELLSEKTLSVSLLRRETCCRWRLDSKQSKFISPFILLLNLNWGTKEGQTILIFSKNKTTLVKKFFNQQ